MKKLLTLVLALLFVLCLCACNQTPEEPVVTEFTFPEGSAVLGVNISGLNREAGWKALSDAVSNHTLELTVDGVEASIAAADIGLSCSRERYDAIADACEAGAAPEFTGLISFNEGKLRALVNEHFNKPVTEAAIVFDEDSGEYVLVPDAIGQSCNPNVIVDALRQTVCDLVSQHTLTDVSQILEPVIRDEDTAVTEALATANRMNDVALTYTFTAEDKTSTHEIPAETIRSFISLGRDGVTPGIDRSALEVYVAELNETYSSGSTKGSFKATGGGTINLTVSYNGVYVDQEALADDIAACIQEGTSGTREAPFQAAGIRDMAYGGTYIEVNLSSQHLWMYKYGECILSTSLVSGKVSSGWCTPNGVFSIYHKSTDTYLEGDDYRTFVNYWMPFYGGYGLHDATWRGSFGGEIYLYGGSHGCVNLPYSSAATIYNNAPVGTKVIVYGGRTSVPPQPQSLGGTTYYSVAEDAGSFKLDISPRYSGPTMSYSSSNSSVASVSGGTVTVKGVGTAVITVSVPAYNGYTSATTSVTIEVHSACDEGRHKLGKPTVTTPATCQPGKQTVSCSKCDHTEEQTIAPVASHKFTTYTQTKAPTCGAAGTKVSTCDTCRTATDTKSIDPTNQHTEGSGEITTAPGCETKGEKTFSCSVCGTKLRTEPVPATGHTYNWLVTTPSTCTTDGVESYVCACGHVADTRPVTATGHNYETQVSNPTCTADGKQEDVCSKCGDRKNTVVLPATGHSMSTDSRDPSCSAVGYIREYCTTCGHEASYSEIPTIAHSFANGSCGVCGAADPNYVATGEGT